MDQHMFAAVVVLLCSSHVNCAASQRTNENRNQLNCSLVKSFFEMRNISVSTQEDATHGEICGGSCCNPSMESNLRLQVQRDFSSMLRHNSHSLQGLLDTTASTLQEHVLSLTRQSENKTLVLFSQVYRSMAILSQDPIKALYSDIRQTIHLNGNRDSFTPSPVDIKSAVIKLFTDLFPLVYHHNINTQHARDFTPSYKVCLRETIHEVQPFGDIPRQIAQSLSKSLEATRLLLQAFNVGVEVLNTTETLLTDEGNEQECHKALLKMSYCPKCLGLHKDVKPCSGYCLNVLHGCITRHVADLDSAWNNYVLAMERLVTAWKQQNNEAGVNVHNTIKGLDTKISEAIMYAMENTPELEKRVKKACGLPKVSDKDPLSSTGTGAPAVDKPSKPQRLASLRDTPPPDTQLVHFLTSVAKSRGFYTGLADSLCRDDAFAEASDQACWNGKRVGEYTDTVVDPSLGMHKYNPEVNFTSVVQSDARIAQLADKLRHVYNTVSSSLGPVNIPQSESQLKEMLGDDPDGSGSGHGDIDDDDGDGVPGSGSGGGDVDNTVDQRHPGPGDADAAGKVADGTSTGGAARAGHGGSLLATLLLLLLAALMLRPL